MFLEFSIPGKPVSINRAKYKHNNAYTKEARQYRDKVQLALYAHREEFEAFNKKLIRMFRSNEWCIGIQFTYNIPKKEFYNQKGEISIRSQDVDNPIKPLIDFMFNNRYTKISHLNSLGEPYLIFGCDDKHICDLSAYKRPTEASEWSTDVVVHLFPMERF